MSHTYEFISMTASLCYSIAHIFIAFGVCHAGWGYYKKVQNDKRMALHDKIFNVYREYSNVISNYIQVINEDKNINFNNPKYKEAQIQLYDTSRICMLLADDNLYLKINKLLDHFSDSSTDQSLDNNTHETKKEYLEQLYNIQNAMRDHLESIKFYT